MSGLGNLFKQAKQAYDITQTVGKVISDVHQQVTNSTNPKCETKSNEPETSKANKVDISKLARVDNEICFSCMKDASNHYHVVLVEHSVSVLNTTDSKQAEKLRRVLNKHPLLVKSAYRAGLLDKFVAEANKHHDWSEIHLACLLGLEDVVRALCIDDVLVTLNSATETGLLPLHISIQQANLSLSKKLLNWEADLRKCDLTTNNCLHYAVKNGLSFVKQLYEMKPQQFKEALNSGNNNDYTPFHMCLKEESGDLVNFLIQCGANTSLIGVDIAELDVSTAALNAICKHDKSSLIGNPLQPSSTILHQKFLRKHLKAVHFLCPEIVNRRNESGQTPLHCTVDQNDIEATVDLLSFGANVNLGDNHGNLPLHLAVRNSNELIVKVLLCFDSECDRKNKENKSVYEMRSTAAIAKLLHQFYNAKRSSQSLEAGNELTDLIRWKQEKTVQYQANLDEELRNKSLRLLSLDGGERQTKSKRIIDYFDWVCGTSTGAIFALSLVEDYTIDQCLRFYLRLKDDVFVGKRPHDEAPLEAFLKECFGEKTMDQIKLDKRVVITTTKSDINPPKLVLIRSYEMPETLTLSIPSHKIKIVKALRCSSAAPTYFSSVDKCYLDGGLIANNPAPDLLSEVYYYNMQLESQGKKTVPIACLVSLGTGRLPEQAISGVDLEMPKTFGLSSLISDVTSTITTIKNLANIFVEQLAVSDGSVVERSRTWAHSLNIPYFRYTPQLDVECPLNTHSNEEVINLMYTAKLYAESISQQEINQIIRLIRAD